MNGKYLKNPEGLSFCEYYDRRPFSTTGMDEHTRHKDIVKLGFDGKNFFKVSMSLSNGNEIADYNVEMIDYIKQLLDWDNPEHRSIYEFCAIHMAARLIHKDTKEVIYGMFCNSGSYKVYYEKEGYFHPYRNAGDYTRQYINPICYPTADSVLYFIEEGNEESLRIYKELDRGGDFDTLVKSHITLGKRFFMDIDKCSDTHSFQKTERWWTINEEAIAQLKSGFTNGRLQLLEGEAEIEEVFWYREEGYNGYPRNVCELQLKAVLPEYLHDNRRASSYKGKYKFGNTWKVDISDFLREIDEKNIENRTNYLHQHMCERAKLLKGERVKILYYPSGISTSNKEYYLNLWLWIPGIYVAPRIVNGMELKGVCPERLQVRVKAEKL